MWGLRLGVSGELRGFGVQGLGLGPQSLGFRVRRLGFEILALKILGFGFRG